jgi:hypothetical protein
MLHHLEKLVTQIKLYFEIYLWKKKIGDLLLHQQIKQPSNVLRQRECKSKDICAQPEI